MFKIGCVEVQFNPRRGNSLGSDLSFNGESCVQD